MALLVGRSALSSCDTRLFGPQPARTRTLCRSCGHRIVANSVVEQSKRRHKPADYFQSLKWDQAGLVPVIVQVIDLDAARTPRSGILMQDKTHGNVTQLKLSVVFNIIEQLLVMSIFNRL